MTKSWTNHTTFSDLTSFNRTLRKLVIDAHIIGWSKCMDVFDTSSITVNPVCAGKNKRQQTINQMRWRQRCTTLKDVFNCPKWKLDHKSNFFCLGTETDRDDLPGVHTPITTGLMDASRGSAIHSEGRGETDHNTGSWTMVQSNFCFELLKKKGGGLKEQNVNITCSLHTTEPPTFTDFSWNKKTGNEKKQPLCKSCKVQSTHKQLLPSKEKKNLLNQERSLFWRTGSSEIHSQKEWNNEMKITQTSVWI